MVRLNANQNCHLFCLTHLLNELLMTQLFEARADISSKVHAKCSILHTRKTSKLLNLG